MKRLRCGWALLFMIMAAAAVVGFVAVASTLTANATNAAVAANVQEMNGQQIAVSQEVQVFVVTSAPTKMGTTTAMEAAKLNDVVLPMAGADLARTAKKWARCLC